MTAPALAPTPSPAPVHGRLALSLQDILTVVARIRADRQPVNDAAAFRTHLRSLLARAEQEGAAAGYPVEDVRTAIFAVVALLDESVLNTRQAALADWARRPLQDELFGGHMGGEWFYQYLERLLARADDPWLADVLEVFHHALLLGFRGRYGGDTASVQVVAQRTGERIARLRGARGDLAPAWQPPDDAVVARDPWVRRLAIGAIVTLVIAAALWGTARATLAGTARDVRALAATAGPTTPER
ncbi:MAG: DotU family type IV/VI secretion system protein [Gemmatimonadaceae bacterium]|nr:DotU family type IV/VI secretion system protein [Gemmatimonadaceae bacterium]